MGGPGNDLRGVGIERRPARDEVDCAIGRAAQRRDPLRHVVNGGVQRCGESIEEFVQRNEVRALHVPVRVLG